MRDSRGCENLQSHFLRLVAERLDLFLVFESFILTLNWVNSNSC